MGCGTSVNQVIDSSLPSSSKISVISINHQYKVENVPPYGLLSGRGYLFGQTAAEKKVIVYNAFHNTFTNLFSRVRIPTPKIHMEPIQIQYERSQEVILPQLIAQKPKPPFNHMFATFFKQDTIFLCGGTTYQLDHVSKNSYFYQIPQQLAASKTNERKLIKFKKTTSMHKSRYSHMGIFHHSANNGFIYVFGGKTEAKQGQDHPCLVDCQKFNINEATWTPIAPMKFARSEGCSFLFRDKIYVFGGISNQRQYPEAIQVYNPQINTWLQLHINLHRGIRSALLFSPSPNKITIMGGRDHLENIKKSVLSYDLNQQTYIWQSNSIHQHCNSKMIPLMDRKQIIVLNGTQNNIIQQYSINSKKWRILNYGPQNSINVNDLNCFCCVSQPIRVESSVEHRVSRNLQLHDQKLYILGNQNYPIIYQLTIQQQSCKIELIEVPMNVRLSSNMQTVSRNSSLYLFGGSLINKAHLQMCSYNTDNKQFKQLCSLNQPLSPTNYHIQFLQDTIYLFPCMDRNNEKSYRIYAYNGHSDTWSCKYEIDNIGFNSYIDSLSVVIEKDENAKQILVVSYCSKGDDQVGHTHLLLLDNQRILAQVTLQNTHKKLIVGHALCRNRNKHGNKMSSIGQDCPQDDLANHKLQNAPQLQQASSPNPSELQQNSSPNQQLIPEQTNSQADNCIIEDLQIMVLSQQQPIPSQNRVYLNLYIFEHNEYRIKQNNNENTVNSYTRVQLSINTDEYKQIKIEQNEHKQLDGTVQYSHLYMDHQQDSIYLIGQSNMYKLAIKNRIEQQRIDMMEFIRMDESLNDIDEFWKFSVITKCGEK